MLGKTDTGFDGDEDKKAGARSEQLNSPGASLGRRRPAGLWTFPSSSRPAGAEDQRRRS